MTAIRVLSNSIVEAPRHVRGRHSDAPLIAAVQEYQSAGTLPFSTPGHKRGAGLEADIQQILGKTVFEADVWLNTADLEDALQHAEDLAADAWGAGSAYYLINGSSSGNHALLLAHLQPGDEAIVA